MKAIGKVYEESWENRKRFKLRPDNRQLNEANIRKITRSFEKYGWYGEPITVTKDMYVIAGQHRLEAACRARIGIKYIIEDREVSQEALRDMSAASRKWTDMDYICSMADGGNDNCKKFVQLYKEFVKMRKILPQNTIVAVVTNTYKSNTLKSLVNEDFSLTIDEYNTAHAMLDKIESVVAPCRVGKVTGRFDYTCNAVYFLLNNGANFEILKARVAKNTDMIRAVVNIEQAIAMMEDVYNKHTRAKDKMYFVSKYKEYLDMRRSSRDK